MEPDLRGARVSHGCAAVRGICRQQIPGRMRAGYDFEGPLLGDKAANVRFDNTKIKRLVPDFAPRVSMAQGIRGAVEYLLAHPELQTPDPEFDTWCDRVLAAQSAAKAVFDGAHLT